MDNGFWFVMGVIVGTLCSGIIVCIVIVIEGIIEARIRGDKS